MPSPVPRKRGTPMSVDHMRRAIHIMGSIFMEGATDEQRKELCTLLNGQPCASCSGRADPSVDAGGHSDASA